MREAASQRDCLTFALDSSPKTPVRTAVDVAGFARRAARATPGGHVPAVNNAEPCPKSRDLRHFTNARFRPERQSSVWESPSCRSTQQLRQHGAWCERVWITVALDPFASPGSLTSATSAARWRTCGKNQRHHPGRCAGAVHRGRVDRPHIDRADRLRARTRQITGDLAVL